MTETQVKKFIADNKELITEKCNEYLEKCNIRLSDFNEDQKNRIIQTIAAREIVDMLP